MDYFHVCLFTFFTWKSIYGSISIVGYGSLQLNSPFVLACYIPSFNNSGATWSNTNLSSNTCDSNGFCQKPTVGNSNFSANESGIFVEIDPLLEKDDNIKWTCFYDSKNISYTVEIGSSNPTGQKESETSNGGLIAGIVVGCVLLVVIIAILWYAREKNTFCFS
ncbi:uncharacterized protein LOC134699025 [Mytilus trossulus]|uniref:uncharacterized protein LOC134699025 n=1 Tax=Mytilus trossulus TaxID=6551 RepID=UPI00300531EC